MNFWAQLPRPLFALAPMDDVTDTVFRQIVAQTAPPDVFFTEFASVDGLQSKGRQAVLQKLRFTESETPLIAQVWGLKPDNFYKTAQELANMGFAGVDLNMGCPVPKVVKMGACSALINNRDLAAEIIAATKAGLDGKIAFSVKTRIGFNAQDLEWTEFLLRQGLDALTIHGRTVKEQSKVPNSFESIADVVTQRDALSPDTIIIANGDVENKSHGRELCNTYGFDGIMIGRGIFHDPYAFSDESPWATMSKEQKTALFLRHIELFDETWGATHNPVSLKKFAKVYVNGFDGASDLRGQIMECANTIEMKQTP